MDKTTETKRRTKNGGARYVQTMPGVPGAWVCKDGTQRMNREDCQEEKRSCVIM